MTTFMTFMTHDLPTPDLAQTMIHDLKPYNFAPNDTIFWSNHAILFQTVQLSF